MAPRTRRVHVEFSLARAIGGEVVELGIDHGSQFRETLGRRGGVDRHRAAVGERADRGEDASSGPSSRTSWNRRLDQPPPNTWWPRRAHTDQGQQATGAPSLGEVHLLDRTRRDDLRHDPGGGAPEPGATLADDGEYSIDPGDDLVVVDRAYHGDHHVRPPVPAVVERPNLRGVDRLHGVGRAEHFPTERMARKQALGEDAVDDVVGRIGAPGDSSRIT